jgi:hypothetical protein
MRYQPNDDQLMDPVLLELQIQIGVSEAAGAPMLRRDDLARLRRKLGPDLATPCTVFERLSLPCRLLYGRNVFPGLVVAGTVTTMRRIEDPKPRLPCRMQDLQHMRNAVIRFCNHADAVPYLAAFGYEIVIGINHQKRGELSAVRQVPHGVAPTTLLR